ncbi:MAG: carbonic anhydrase [Gammaproteobacteria bacterium]|jgi:carbonic anhydrase
MDPIASLIAGFAGLSSRQYRESRKFRQLVERGQSPRIVLVACSDSRVDPSLMLDCNPGDLFVIRNVANLVPPCEESGTYHGTSAALEYAICQLGVEHVIVMGHARCGGIQALIDGPSDTGGFIGRWVSLAKPALEKTNRQLGPSADPAERAQCCELESIKQSLINLKTFPWIEERLESGRLQLHGWYFDLVEGRLLGHDTADDAFHVLTP